METKSSLLGAAVESGTDTENAYGVHDNHAHDDDINGQLTKPQPVNNNSSTVLLRKCHINELQGAPSQTV